MADLKVELALRKDEINKLKVRAGCLERIKEVVGTLRDVFNKARLFDEDIKTEREVSVVKIVKVLVTFTRKMETALVDIRKIVSGSSARESSQPPITPPTETPRKEKPLEEIKTPLLQRSSKETIAEGSREVPPAEFTSAKLPDPAITLTSKEKKSESSEPSSQKQKKKEQTPEYEELDELMEGMGSSERGTESEDEATLATPPTKKRRSINTRSLGKKGSPLLSTRPHSLPSDKRRLLRRQKVPKRNLRGSR